ncbi:MAG: glutamine synthetase family protein [Polyangiales bacterium]
MYDPAFMTNDSEFFRRTFEEQGIRKVRVGGFDVDGVLRGKFMHPEKFYSALRHGFGFCDVIFGWDVDDKLYDNAKVTGWHTGYPDALAKIDPSTFRISPREPDTALFLVDFFSDPSTPHPACPRNLLKTVIARSESAGYQPMFALEFEFWIFRETPQSLYDKGFDNLEPLTPGMFGYSWLRQTQMNPLVHDILDTMAAYKITLEGIHTETGPGVWEACIKYDHALAAADKAAMFKTTLKEICSRHGYTATFMAKWSDKQAGSSGHMHQSLWDGAGTTNGFSSDSTSPLSPTGMHYLGGLLKTSRELTAVYAPFTNSYRRYVPGVWAPTSATWAIENRTCSARVITGPTTSSSRIEFRQPGADINPYTAVAAALGAGLHGIDNQIEAPPATQGDATQSNEKLPRTLAEATALLQASAVAPQILTPGFVDHYVRTRQWESRQVDDDPIAERRRYFEVV